MITCSKLGRYGRLGNQMFQIASVIGIAKASGQNFAFPYWKNYDHLERFGSTEDIDVQSYFKNPLPVLQQDLAQFQHRFVHWGYHPTRLTRGNWDIEGHLQSEKYFLNAEAEVRHYFGLKDDDGKTTNSTAIHVRLGDYDNKYHPRLNEEYYAPAIAEIKPEEIILFSDDLDEAMQIIKRACYLAKHSCTIYNVDRKLHYMTAFSLMKSCKHFIIGNSTFSWWAAWLGTHPEKKVIAPKKWFGIVDGQQYLNSDDIYCKDWIVL